jgi:hypothetical protein
VRLPPLGPASKSPWLALYSDVLSLPGPLLSLAICSESYFGLQSSFFIHRPATAPSFHRGDTSPPPIWRLDLHAHFLQSFHAPTRAFSNRDPSDQSSIWPLHTRLLPVPLLIFQGGRRILSRSTIARGSKEGSGAARGRWDEETESVLDVATPSRETPDRRLPCADSSGHRRTARARRAM